MSYHEHSAIKAYPSLMDYLVTSLIFFVELPQS
jgi:hypothetical protein